MSSSAKDIQLRDLKDTISQLKTMLSEQTELIKALRLIIEEKDSREKEHQEREKLLQEQIDYLTKKLFGTSSEKSSLEVPGQLNLFNEAEVELSNQEPEAVVKEHTRKKKTTYDDKFKGIPVNTVVIELPEEEQFCPVCNTHLEPIGKVFVRRELEYIPASLTVTEYYSTHYGCPECKSGSNDTPVILKAEVPAPLMKHGYASASSVAWTMYQKYANAIPLYRQEKDWKQYGAELSRTTLANWIITCALEYFKPMYDFFHQELIKRNFLMADETRVQVLNEPGRRAETDSFMWLFRTGEDGLPAVILYGYSPTRAGYNAANFLSGFTGYLETDGYQGYNKVPGIKRCSCWSHVRRYFIDAVPKGKQYDYSQPAVQGVQFCNKLFALEDSINQKHCSYEKRKQLRLEKEKPVLEAFWSWLENQQPTRNSRMYKAVQYTLNRKPYLETYLEDGRCSFSNNLSENAIRPFTVGRKNWLFSTSTEGAEASAIVYTMVEMAKAHNLNIYGYLKFLLEHRPGTDMTDEQLEELAPWSEMLQSIKNN